MSLTGKTLLGLWTGKLTQQAVATLHLGAGTTLPGRVARALDASVLSRLSQQVTGPAVAVTGTNGKTTTCGLLAKILETSGRRVVHNLLGANMLAGITSAFVQQASLAGRLHADVGVLEVDEASLVAVAEEVSIQSVVVTNLFRDQLDRYGELDTTARMIAEGIRRTGQQMGQPVILNADDPLVASLGREFPSARYYGLETLPEILSEIQSVSASADSSVVPFAREVTTCPACDHPLQYTRIFYGHLGHYHCEGCGDCRPTPTWTVRVTRLSPRGTELIFHDAETGVETPLSLPLPGVFNVYNLLAAITAARSLGVSSDKLQAGVSAYHSVFGRAERVTLHGKSAMIFLIKNPVGASEVLKLVASDPNGRVLIAIHDNYADGRDVSWLWDATFEALPKNKPIGVSGQRAQDMAMRLKYAGVPTKNIWVEPDLKQALRHAAEATGLEETLYVLPTYTALLQLQQ